MLAWCFCRCSDARMKKTTHLIMQIHVHGSHSSCGFWTRALPVATPGGIFSCFTTVPGMDHCRRSSCICAWSWQHWSRSIRWEDRGGCGGLEWRGVWQLLCFVGQGGIISACTGSQHRIPITRGLNKHRWHTYLSGDCLYGLLPKAKKERESPLESVWAWFPVSYFLS